MTTVTPWPSLVSAVLATNDLVERWRGLGPGLWIAAAGAAALWGLALLALLARSEPRRVAPGPPTLESGGREPPAVVNLVTSDWELGRESVPATLLDLAARGFVSIDSVGERTLVRVREQGPDDGPLTGYERMVLDHLRALSHETTDGFVPADALTTGPEALAQTWWRRFERGVVEDARSRSLSRPRWGPRERAILTALAVVVGVAVGIAATTLTGSKKNDDPVGAAVGMGIMSAVLLITLGSKLHGERDTPDGRATAGRWLGLRATLANDPMFAAQPPAAVAIWDRLLAYGAALGMARAAVETLPLGAESERHAWSPVGGHWRVVKIRYPRRLPPGYGRRPVLVALVGVLVTAAGVLVAPGAVSVADALLRTIADNARDHRTPAGVRAAVGVALAAVVLLGVLVALYGACLLVGGAADLVRRRRDVEGRVLRLRQHGDEQRPLWHLAVDEGSSDHIRAWRLPSAPAVRQGATVRARVSPWLHHVADLATVHEDQSTVPVATAATTPTGGAVGAAPPALPDAGAVTTALGFPVDLVPTARPYPLAIAGASATFVARDGGRVIASWLRPEEFEEFRQLPRTVAAPVAGVGDEAYRAPMGGGLVARVGAQVLMVMATLPGRTDVQRDQAVEAVARSVVEQAGDH